jgi:serine/threonine-protein kinase RsbW
MTETLPLAPSIELLFPSEFGYEKIARETVAAFARRLGFEQDRIEDLKTALCEACVNAIEHGNQHGPGLRVSVTCVGTEQLLLIEIIDQGRKRYQGSPPPADIDSKVGGKVPLRGMGLMIIAQLVDEAGFVETAEEGNCFRLTMYRRRRDQPVTSDRPLRHTPAPAKSAHASG